MKHRICLILFLIMIMTYSFAIDNSGANIPELYQGLYPVKYDESGNVVFTNKNDSNWYNYTEGKWANAVTLDKEGQMNPAEATENNITGYYVWIPRYAYQIRTGYNSSETGRIDIRFLKGATNKDSNGKEYYTVEAFENESNRWEELNTITYVGDRQMDYLVHPAFRFDQELSGIWVGKHEARKGIEREIELVNTIPNEALWTSIDINSSIEVIRNMTSKSENYDKYNLYGLSEEVNTHLIKAVEYGAVVYLANSMYGDNTATEIYRVNGINQDKEYIAGALEGSLELIDDKYIDTYKKDGEIIDIKGSAYLETSDGENAWENQTINNITDTNGIIVKENAYGIVASNGEETDVGFRVVLTKGENKNEIKEAYEKDGSYWWLMKNGDLWGMGNNEDGQLGIGNNEYKYIPIKVENDKDGNKIPAIERVVCIEDKIYYIAKNGDKYLNGSINTDEINLEDDTINIVENLRQEQLEEYNELGEIKSIYGNATSTIFEEVDGDIYVIGENQNNKLGISGITNITTPMKLSIKGIKDVGIGSDFGVFLQDNGNIIGYGNTNKNGNGLTNISQIAVQNDKAYFMRTSGIVIDNQSNIISSDAYKIAAGANYLVVLKKDGTTETYGQANSNLIDVIDIFAGKNMTVYITKDNKTYLMEDNSLTELPIKNIVYAELNGSEPYFLTYDRELLYKNGAYVTVGETKLHRIREIKGDIVLTENNKLYNFGDVMNYEKTFTGDRIEIKTMQEEYLGDLKIYGQSIQGRNAFDISTMSERIYAYFHDARGWAYASDSYSVRVPVLPNTTYTISTDNDNITIFRAGCLEVDDIPEPNLPVTAFNGVLYTNNTPITITTTANTKYIAVQSDNRLMEETLKTLTIYPQVTPTPDNPIEIESVGDKAINLINNYDVIPDPYNSDTIGTLEGATINDEYIDIVRQRRYDYAYIPVSLKANTPYTVWYEYTVYDREEGAEGKTALALGFGAVKIDGCQKYLYENTTGEIIYRYTPTEDVDTWIRVFANYGSDVPAKVKFKVMLLEGEYTLDNIPEYEPYCNPHYEGYKIPIKVRGKNFFDGEIQQGAYLVSDGKYYNTNNYISNKNPIKINDVEGDIYTLSRNHFSNGFLQFVLFYNENMEYLGYQQLSSDGMFTVIEGAQYVVFDIAANNADRTITPDDAGIIQLEKGKKATEYEPYVVPQTYDIYLDEPLRKIGDYVDYIDFENKKVVRNVGEYVFDGTEYFLDYESTNEYKRFVTSAVDSTAKTYMGKNIYSNYFNGTELLGTLNCIRIASGGCRTEFYLKPTKFVTIRDFKNWLAIYKPVLNYVLETPTVEVIELPNIQLHKGTNIIEIGTDTEPSKIEINYKGTILD